MLEGAGSGCEGDVAIDPAVLELIGAIYDGVLERSRWQRFVKLLSAALGGAATALVVQRSGPDRESIAFTEGFAIGPASGRTNPWRTWLRDAPVGHVGLYREPGEAEARASALYRELLGPCGVGWAPWIGLVLARDELGPCSHLVALPLLSGRALGEPAVSRVEQLAPHLLRAREIHLSLVRKGAAAEGLFGAMDRLQLGVLLLDEYGRVVFANRSACELTGIEDGHRISRADREAIRRWGREALRGSLLESMDPGTSGALVTPHPDDGRPLQVLVSPLATRAADLIPGIQVATAVFLGDPKRVPARAGEVLRALYGLSPGEERLALALAADRSLEEAAAELRIQLSTARGRLKRVFAKTGARRQASLVHLVHTAPALLRSGGVRVPDRG